MLLENFADLLNVLVQKVLLLVMLHPVGHQRATAADDAGNALTHQRHMFAQDTGMNGHVVDALLGLLFDDFEHQVESKVFGAAHAGNRFIDRDGADWDWRSVDDGFADGGNVAAGAQVHDGVGSVVDGVMQFLQLFVDVGTCGGIADVRVDLTAGGDADGHGLEIPVMDVGRDDAATARDLAANQLRLELFALGNVLHLLGDDAVAGKVHLRHVAIPIRGNLLTVYLTALLDGYLAAVAGEPLFNPAIAHCHELPPEETVTLRQNSKQAGVRAARCSRRYDYGTRW